MPVDKRFNSHAWENLVEHWFLAELLCHMWFDRERVVEVSKAEVDSWGYDVVLAVEDTARYVQLKTSVPCDVHERLASREGGCIVAVIVGEIDRKLKYRLWDRTVDMENLRQARSTVYRRNQNKVPERRAHRIVPSSHFSPKMNIKDLCDRLFPQVAQNC
jgi:hypothetical protein